MRVESTALLAAAVETARTCRSNCYAPFETTVGGERLGVRAGEFQSERPRRPATEQSEGAQLGAPPERASSRSRLLSPTMREALRRKRTPRCQPTHYEKIIKLRTEKGVCITRLTPVVLFFAPARHCLWYETTNGRILAPAFFPQIS